MAINVGAVCAQAILTLDVMIQKRLTAPQVGDWIKEAALESSLYDWSIANLRKIERSWYQATCIPKDLVAANSKARSDFR